MSGKLDEPSPFQSMQTNEANEAVVARGLMLDSLGFRWWVDNDAATAQSFPNVVVAVARDLKDDPCRDPAAKALTRRTGEIDVNCPRRERLSAIPRHDQQYGRHVS